MKYFDSAYVYDSVIYGKDLTRQELDYVWETISEFQRGKYTEEEAIDYIESKLKDRE